MIPNCSAPITPVKPTVTFSVLKPTVTSRKRLHQPNADGSWNYANGIASQAGLESGNFHYGPGDVKFKDLDGNGKIDGGKAQQTTTAI